MNIRKLIIGFVGVICSCQPRDTSVKSDLDIEYVLLWRKGQLDTVKRALMNWTVTDSFNIIAYKTDYPWNDEVDETTYTFPGKSELDSLTQYKFFDEKTFHFEGKDYRIIKYLEGQDSDDGQMLYFYSPDFGILIFRTGWWGNYERITSTGDAKRDKIIYFLTERIANEDTDFFKKW